MSPNPPLYRIQFISGNHRYELYVRELSQGNLFGFIQIGDFVFDHHSTMVVDPGEEKLKREFADVSHSYIPMHNVLRIDVVNKQGSAKLVELGDKVTPFPTPIYTPKKP